MSPKRRTTGIRVPDCPICLALIQALGNPIVSTSALSVSHGDQVAGDPSAKAELFDRLEGRVDIIIDDEQPMGYQVSSILDLTAEQPVMTRQGLGAEAAFACGVVAADS